MNDQAFDYTPISKIYTVNYAFGIPNVPGGIYKVKFYMTADGFVFNHPQFKVFIPYSHVENFEILKGAGLRNGIYGLAYETLFQITYVNQFNQLSTARFEMSGSIWNAGFYNNLQADCHSIMDFLNNNRLFSKFRKTAVPQENAKELLQNDPISQIEKLGELLEKGLITSEEFKEKKTKLLNQI